MKRFLMMVLALTMLLAGCSTEVTEYRQQQPRLDIFDYFQGKPKRGAWCRIAAVNRSAAFTWRLPGMLSAIR